MADEKLVELLLSDVKEWNKAFSDRTTTAPMVDTDLSGADLSNADLSGVDLGLKNLKGSSLKGVNLSYARLWNSDLRNSKFNGASLKKADLSEAYMERADFTETDFEQASMTTAIANNACFSGANFHLAYMNGVQAKNANFRFSKFSDAVLRDSDFQDCDFSGSFFNNTNLENANLSGADFRSARGYILDNNLVRGTNFDARAKDPWSILRRTYTGPRLLFNLLFLLVFLIPYTSKIVFWTGVNYYQSAVINMKNQDSVSNSIGTYDVGNLSLCLEKECIPISVWELILGLDKEWYIPLIALSLITYNILKALLTWFVAPMREEEERSGYTPSWKGKRFWQGYWPLYQVHRLVNLILWIAIASFAFNAWYWLTQIVWIPA